MPNGGTGSRENHDNDVDGELLALTWIDPVLTEVVKISSSSSSQKNESSSSRRLQASSSSSSSSSSSTTLNEQNNLNVPPMNNNNKNNNKKNNNQNENLRRMLSSSKKKKSHIHGTNGYMLPLHSTSELLGIAHFHRPEGRETSDYARHGHHYSKYCPIFRNHRVGYMMYVSHFINSIIIIIFFFFIQLAHAFFTIQLSSTSNKYFLKRLSNEFIFIAPSSDDDYTGDVIQFTSGLDLIGSDQDGKLLVSYGINDCEAATFFMGMDAVQELLLDVDEGLEVVDLMEKLQI